ncbi:MAG: hypothetical protein IT331_15975 [Anaerolineae bacterium]|nr:hypothetical protein [Anaerolineae bacterium]
MKHPLEKIPGALQGAAADAKTLFDAGKFRETVTLCQQRLGALEKKVPPRYTKIPREAEPDSPVFQYYALTVVLVDALAELQDWKAAKEALGKYRVRFARDPWGFRAGAEVTRRDPHVKDKPSVTRAVELLEGEAARLEGLKR